MKKLGNRLFLFARPVRGSADTLFAYFNQNKLIGFGVPAKESVFLGKKLMLLLELQATKRPTQKHLLGTGEL